MMTNDEMQSLLDLISASNDAAHSETRRHFDTVAERLERKSDALSEAVALVEQRVTREGQRLDEKLDRGFSETQAMIRFSHAELDRRVAALEEGQRAMQQTIVELQSRIERIESSTQ